MLQIEESRELLCPLTQDEVDARIREARGRTDTIADLDSRLARLAADTKAAKEEIAVEQREVKRLVRIADAREEPRYVECRWTYDLATNTATLVRLDSAEVVQSRPLTGEERRELEQRPLFEEQAKAARERMAQAEAGADA